MRYIFNRGLHITVHWQQGKSLIFEIYSKYSSVVWTLGFKPRDTFRQTVVVMAYIYTGMSVVGSTVPFFRDMIYMYECVCVCRACDAQIADRQICVHLKFPIENPSATNVPFIDTESVYAAQAV